jgi:hypothetical protein
MIDAGAAQWLRIGCKLVGNLQHKPSRSIGGNWRGQRRDCVCFFVSKF